MRRGATGLRQSNSRWLFRALILAVAGMCCVSQTVLALSPEQRKVLDSNVRYFNVEVTKFTNTCSTTGSGGGGGSSDLIGGENDEKIWNFLIRKGLTAIQAAGIMGNFQAESGFDPTIVQGGGHSDTIIVDGETGYGIAQWTFITRQQALLDFATQGGKPATNSSDLATQLDFMYMEATTGSLAGSWDALKEQENIPDATVSWHNKYESSADTAAMIQNRIDMAEENFNKFSSSGGGSTSSPGSKACATDGNGQVVGGFSLPVDRRWYDEHPDWFAAPHHDYPSLDIPVPSGTNIYSVTAGKVIEGGNSEKCGVGIIIDAGNGVHFIYCHGTDGEKVPNAEIGDEVKAGQLIMHSETTGNSSGPHLHLQITINGTTDHCPQTLMKGIVDGSPPQPKDLPTSGCVG